jgi:hypothetical protein
MFDGSLSAKAKKMIKDKKAEFRLNTDFLGF